MDLARRRLRLAGFALIALAGVFGLMAVQHMQTLAAYGHICGGAAPHCPACPASLAAFAAGVAALGFSAAPRRRRVRIDR